MTEAEIIEKIHKLRAFIENRPVTGNLMAAVAVSGANKELAELEAQLIVMGMAGRRPDLPDGKDFVDEVRGHQVFLDECSG